MTTQNEIIIANEVKSNFKLILIGVVFTIILYLGLYITNRPYDKPALQSKYDYGLTTEMLQGDSLEKIREVRFLKDIKETTFKITPWIFVILISGRYFIKLLTWANKTSKQNE